MAGEKPGVLERLGAALNSSDLSPNHERLQSVDLITALAYTQTNPDAAEHEKLELAAIDPRTELASILVRLKYGGDRTLGERAVNLLVHWVRHQRAFKRWKLNGSAGTVLQRFARHALAEWLFTVCEGCSGRQMLGMDKGEIIERRQRCTRCRGTGAAQVSSKKGVPVVRDCTGCAGRGWRTYQRVRQRKPEQCGSCKGTGRKIPNDAERANMMGIDIRLLERHWVKRFSWLAAGLDGLDKLEQHCLQSQLRRGTTPPDAV